LHRGSAIVAKQIKGEHKDDNLKAVTDESFSSEQSNTFTKDKRGSEFTFPQSSNKKANGRPLPPSNVSIGAYTSNTGGGLIRKGTHTVHRQDDRNETVSDDGGIMVENRPANVVLRGNVPLPAEQLPAKFP
jgi:hypothetical protein